MSEPQRTGLSPDQQGEIARTLHSVWGFDALRPLQQDVLEAALAQRDAVIVMPTGGGKSLCFQVPPLVTGDLTVCVSPLIALMKDQVDGLKLVGVPAAALNSSLSQEEARSIENSVLNGTVKLLYVSPERLALNSTIDLLRRANQGKGVARFAIDEAHCISAWGHDFRPEYRQLGRLKESFPNASVQAFTATATPRVRRDIAIQLRLERPRLFVGTFDRPNLTYRVIAKEDSVQVATEAIKRYPDEGVIIYCLSRKDTERIADALASSGVSAVAYHAGLTPPARKKISEDFAQERVNVVAATIAFGMGIDRSNVRCVIHECLPKSMEGYQQETGRAGRDGLPSECILLYRPGDVTRLRKLMSDSPPDVFEHNMKLLDEVRRFATSHQCRHQALSQYFGQEHPLPEEGCGACDVCLGGISAVPNGDAVARTILQAALDLQSSFGASFLAGVLTGSRSGKIEERGAHLIDGFGKLSAHTTALVNTWIQQLGDRGFFQATSSQYPVLRLTDAGRQALHSDEPIPLLENLALTPSRSRKRREKALAVPEHHAPLFQALRAWRKQTAEERGVPPYVILHDATLMKISAIRPSSVARLRAISGVGDRRADEFGEQLVTLVTSFAQSAGLPLDHDEAPERQEAAGPAQHRPPPRDYVLLFDQGKSLDEVAQRRGITPATAASHLEAWILVRKPNSIATWIDPDELEAATSAFEAVGMELLKPAFEKLGGTIPYDRLRVIRAFLRVTRP